MIGAQLCFGLTGMAVLMPQVALSMVVASAFGQWIWP
jgi:hypothetical protein